MPKSLSIRLLLIFIVGFILLLGLLRLGVGHSLKSEIQSLQAGSLMRFTHIILERGTQQVDFKRALRVSERTGMDIHIVTDTKKWSSNGELLDVSKYQFSKITFHKFAPQRHKNRKRSNIDIKVAKGLKKNIYRVTTENAILYYEVENHRGGFGWYFILIAAVFIIGLYLAIRYLFAPVADIKRVVQEVSRGNFKARTNTKRKDDLGQLAEKVDQMAGEIDRLIESKRSLLLGISHELKTPLTHAKVCTSLMEASKHRDDLIEDIDEMNSIITDLTEAERLSEDAPLARQVVDINDLIDSLINESFADKKITFMPLEGSPFVNIDPIRVKLLVKNLLKNALQYSAENKLTPKISMELDKQYLTIHVIDRGVGMPAHFLDRLAEPFYRLDQARQRKTGGFGLGLYLCNAIAKAHHGSLDIQSKEGYGTTVSAIFSLSDQEPFNASKNNN